MASETPYNAFTMNFNGIATQICSEAVIINGTKEFLTNRALWDTGATVTCISTHVADKLNLIRTGLRNIQTPSGGKTVNTYLVNIRLPNHVLIIDVPVCDSNIGEQDIDLLIGMDIITRGDFSLTQVNDKTTFSFCIPPVEKSIMSKSSNFYS